MGRSPCCDKLGLKKGPWTPEEDQKLLVFIEEHGHGNWRALPSKAGLQRCGKSCRLRWTNYLRPDIKRGKFSLQEEQTIIQLHALLGNRWSAIATHLPKRTDNEIKNYWNTHLKKRLAKMGIDPVTHKPKNNALLSAADGGQQSKNAANLSHMAQWESARLEAEARLVRQSKLRSSTNISDNSSSVIAPLLPVLDINDQHQIVPSVSVGPLSSSSSTSAHHYLTMTSACVSGGAGGDASTPRCLDVLKAWNNGGGWPSTSSASANNDGFLGISMVSTGIGSGGGGGGVGVGMESPTSTLSFSENNAPPMVTNSGTTAVIEFMGHHHDGHEDDNQDMVIKKEGHHHNHSQNEWSSLSFIPSSVGFHDINALSVNQTTTAGERDNDDGNDNDDDDENHHAHDHGETFMEGFTDLLLSNNTNAATKNDIPVEKSQEEDDNSGSRGTNTSSSKGSDYYEDNKTFWNSILNLVNSSPPNSPMF